MFNNNYYSLLIVLTFIFFACNTPNTGTVSDEDGNVYKTVKIGNQWWMAENLKVTSYRNGEAIPKVLDTSQWAALTTGAYCAYNNVDSNATVYGLLYNWYAVTDNRNLAPTGWHVATDADWKELEMYTGMSQTDADGMGYRGTDEGDKLKETGTDHWYFPNKEATDEYGFAALPGGYRGYGTLKIFAYITKTGSWWTPDEYDSEHSLSRLLDYKYSESYRSYSYKHNGYSVRCVKD